MNATDREEGEMPGRRIEDLTMQQLAGVFMRQPARTRKAWQAYMSGKDSGQYMLPLGKSGHSLKLRSRLSPSAVTWSRLQLSLYALSVVVGWHGGTILRQAEHSAAESGVELAIGAPYLWLAAAIWLLGELAGHWTEMRTWWLGVERIIRYCYFGRVVPILIWCSAIVPLNDATMATGETVLPLLADAVARIVFGIVIWWLINLAARKRKTGRGTLRESLSRLQAIPVQAAATFGKLPRKRVCLGDPRFARRGIGCRPRGERIRLDKHSR